MVEIIFYSIWSVCFVVFLIAAWNMTGGRTADKNERRRPPGILVRDAIDDTQYAKRRTRFTAYKLLRKVRGGKR